jgi:hypothetical protein
MVNMVMVKKAIGRQSTMITIYGLLAIMVLLRLAPGGIVGWSLRWAKVSVAMFGRKRNDFVFVVRCVSEEVLFD